MGPRGARLRPFLRSSRSGTPAFPRWCLMELAAHPNSRLISVGDKPVAYKATISAVSRLSLPLPPLVGRDVCPDTRGPWGSWCITGLRARRGLALRSARTVRSSTSTSVSRWICTGLILEPCCWYAVHTSLPDTVEAGSWQPWSTVLRAPGTHDPYAFTRLHHQSLRHQQAQPQPRSTHSRRRPMSRTLPVAPRYAHETCAASSEWT